MQKIRDYYIAAGAVVTGDVVLGPGVNIWYGCVIRGDVARVTISKTAASSTPITTCRR
jgi:carbonic anhydrase/acetyltransferase-like protein (isoleucine patch superfamily)